jgi:hypothetical protein
MEKMVEHVVRRGAYTRHVRLREYTCPICTHRFWAGPLARYCSKSCRNRASYIAHAEQRKTEQRARYQQRKQARA